MFEVGKWYICDPFRGHKKEDGWVCCQIEHTAGTVVQCTRHAPGYAYRANQGVGNTINVCVTLRGEHVRVHPEYVCQWYELSDEEVTIHKMAVSNV